ncbi:FadR/GntR family transcriptional regulator [Antarcticirhabdus aurantiaca]|uniref:FadR/GntR family transcriptional regulator n=1 Tax=Antarcticirhabdus aurantiaca TaxID=2606717 RepID=A0ACD4NRF9_9HYPH|nr:FadR/GntR family transcriptional regulator [Antarcticirhabdus aurantiaca]WAJ29386.1 FadR/GntR family transcriptional regulator [Jeongeuplla avenae]
MKSSVEEAALRPSQAGHLSDRIYETLRERIAGGVYGADERLPGEYDLAAQFDVSRPIVREALERLRGEGLIYSRRGAGSFARPSRPAAPVQQLGFAPVETIADIQRCYEFRLTIEPEAAAYAARRRNDEAMARIEAALAMLDDATRQQRHREDADFAFHLAVAKAANNHYHLSALQALREHIAVGMKLHGLTLMGPTPGLQRVFAEHTGIFEAIRDKDPEAASARMRSHLQGSLDRLFEGRLLDLAL